MTSRLLIALACTALLAVQVPAQAWTTMGSGFNASASAGTSTGSSKPKKPKTAKKAKPNKAATAVFYEGNGETRAERDKRLARECRGRPNAGVCEGHTRP